MSISSTPAEHLLFLHIQKTAGATFHNIIGRQYSKSETISIYNMQKDAELVAVLPLAQREKTKLVKGHFSFGMHKNFSGRSEYITLLREPIERTISHFYFIAADKNHQHYETIQRENLSFHDVLQRKFLKRLDNNMVRLLSGNDKVPYGECTQEMFDIASYNLENYFPIIGLQSHFDEFILQAANRFGWKHSLTYRKKFVSETKVSREKLDAKTIEAIKNANVFDQKLFDKWEPIIKQRIAHEGEEFQKSVLRFKKKNQFMNRYFGWWPESLTR